VPTLRIIYGDIPLFEGEVDAFRWDDVPGQSVTVTGQISKAKAGGGLTALTDMLTAASRQRTEAKRAELTAEPTEES
jgi:hypothetical protein